MHTSTYKRALLAVWACLLILAALLVVVGTQAEACSRVRPTGRHHWHSAPPMSSGILQIGAYKYDFFATVGQTVLTPAIGSPSGTPIELRSRPATVKGASPPLGIIRELRQISLPLAADIFEGATLPKPEVLNFDIGLIVGGMAVWRQSISLPLSPFSATAKVGGSLFSADFVNPIPVYPGQEVRVFASIPMAEGANQGALAWSVIPEKTGEFLLFQPTNTGGISYTDMKAGGQS